LKRKMLLPTLHDLLKKTIENTIFQEKPALASGFFYANAY